MVLPVLHAQAEQVALVSTFELVVSMHASGGQHSNTATAREPCSCTLKHCTVLHMTEAAHMAVLEPATYRCQCHSTSIIPINIFNAHVDALL